MAEPRVIGTNTGSATRNAVEINHVLRSTYMLLAMTIGFSSLMAVLAIQLQLPYMGFLPYIIGFFALSWAVNKTANSGWGLFWTFAFTGFIGISMGPIIGFYMAAPNGGTMVAQALGITATAFFGLSLYTITTKKDFSFLSSFLVMGFFIMIGVIICSLFFDLSPFAAAISGMMVLIAAALMLFETSRIVLGGETNYIIATNNLFVSIYLMFMNLLAIFGIMGGDD